MTFFKGAQLKPLPPFESKHKDVRGLDLFEDKPFDETQFGKWVSRAAKIPGWMT